MTMRKMMAFAVVGVLLAAVVSADTYIVQKRHTDEFTIMGQTQPAKDQENHIWLGADRMRNNMGDMSIIVRMDEKKLYFVDHKNKTFTVLELPLDFKKIMPPEMAGQADQMLKMMQMTTSVTPTEETKKIKDWNAKKYVVDIKSAMMQMKMELWASTDVGVDNKAFMDMSAQMASIQPGMKEMMDEMKKVDGFTVYSETVLTMMGTDNKSSEELVSVETKDAPADNYAPPKDYTEKQANYQEMVQTMQNM